MSKTYGRVMTFVKKLDREIGFDDYDSLPIESRRFLANYGWKQWCADAHAGDARSNFPTGEAGTQAWKDKVLEHVMERHTVITTGVGLPGEKLSPIAKLAAQAGCTEAEFMAALEMVKKAEVKKKAA